MKNTLVLAHYYTEPKVQQLADFVGDSLELSLRARDSNAERIVFAGVKFMAETAKIINPNAEVILPDEQSTCSLVTMTDVEKVKNARLHGGITFPKFKVITYINSSVELKAISDIIVTSANVEEIVSDTIAAGYAVLFTPDRNMGAYLRFQHPEWVQQFFYMKDAVCEVHDKFKSDEIRKVLSGWTDYSKYLLAHPESPLPVLELADYVGSTKGMLNWVKNFQYKNGIIYVATEEGLLHNMREVRPELDIRLAPTYSGCQCNACPYMKKNTVEAVQSAIDGKSGLVIDYIPEDMRKLASLPIERMLAWK